MRNEIFLKRLCDMLSVVYKYFKFFLILIVKTLNNFIFRTLRGINGIPMNVIDNAFCHYKTYSLVTKVEIKQKITQFMNYNCDN